jgi:DNA-binding transcriptional regulator YdaS (Cro superfamily)
MGMNLKEYFSTEPRGSKQEMADHLGISFTWLSLLINNKRTVSPMLAVKIDEATQQLVSKEELLPSIFK